MSLQGVYPTSHYQLVFGMCGMFGVWDALQRICAMQQFYVCDAVVVVLIDGSRVSAATVCCPMAAQLRLSSGKLWAAC